MSDAYMSSKEVIEKEEKAYNLFSNRPPKDILAILNLHDDGDYKRHPTLSSNSTLKQKVETNKGIFIKNFSVENNLNMLEKPVSQIKLPKIDE